MRLEGKTALITGGGTGIGAGIARCFAQEGCHVVITGRREQKLREVAESATGPHRMIYRAADVADAKAVAALVEWSNQQLGRIDILVNNAGVNILQRQLTVLSKESWDLLMNVIATGTFNMVHAVLPQMRQRRDGVIISISSIAGCRASVLGGAAYSAAKHAMTAFTKVVGIEEKENGIRATVIAPGEVNTPILEERPVKVSADHKAQILQPEDVAEAALLVATLHPRASIPELVIKPTTQEFD